MTLSLVVYLQDLLPNCYIRSEKVIILTCMPVPSWWFFVLSFATISKTFPSLIRQSSTKLLSSSARLSIQMPSLLQTILSSKPLMHLWSTSPLMRKNLKWWRKTLMTSSTSASFVKVVRTHLTSTTMMSRSMISLNRLPKRWTTYPSWNLWYNWLVLSTLFTLKLLWTSTSMTYSLKFCSLITPSTTFSIFKSNFLPTLKCLSWKKSNQSTCVPTSQ